VLLHRRCHADLVAANPPPPAAMASLAPPGR
jgi:hypothetical protein